MSDWVKRAYNPETDENAVVYLWLKSYARAHVNAAKGAHVTRSPAELAYWRRHAPIVECLLRVGKTDVLCDPERVNGVPVIYAFACSSPDAVHYAVVKRDYEAAGLAGDMFADLFGSSLKNPMGYTHDLVGMKGHVPSSWYDDRWWLSRQFVGGERAA